MALLCLNSWGRAMREVAAAGDMRIVVRDESWKQLRLGIDAVKSFDADLRLSRRDGDIQFAMAHKPSDLVSVGDAGSQAAAIAKDMLHLADTKILHGQDGCRRGTPRTARTCPTLPSTSSPTGAAKHRAAPCGSSESKCSRSTPCSTRPRRRLTWTNTSLEGASVRR